MSDHKFDEAETILKRAIEQFRDRPIQIEFHSMSDVVSLIAVAQVGLRHPQVIGMPTGQRSDRILRGIIDAIDPIRGDLHAILMAGFDPAYDVRTNERPADQKETAERSN